jgi:hypothetical protein
MNERRETKRISTSLTVRWSTSLGSQEGKVIDLCGGGCFVLTANRMPANQLSQIKQLETREPILIDLPLSGKEPLKLRAEVVYKVERVGFGVRFLDLDSHEEQALKTFIEKQSLVVPKKPPFPRVET